MNTAVPGSDLLQSPTRAPTNHAFTVPVTRPHRAQRTHSHAASRAFPPASDSADMRMSFSVSETAGVAPNRGPVGFWLGAQAFGQPCRSVVALGRQGSTFRLH